MDPLLEPFSNQPPAPAKLSIFTILNVLFLVNKLQSLTGTNPQMEIHFLFPLVQFNLAFLPADKP